KQVKRGSTPLASLAANGVLTAYGSAVANTIAVDESDDNLLINVSGRTQSFATVDVTRINILAGGGNDRVDAHATLKPIYVDAGSGNDTVTGSAADDTLTGGAGKNF